MSRARGNALPNAFARYLQSFGWIYAEAAGAGRNGTDITNTPGIVWEIKTANDFRRDFKPTAWVKQSKGHAKSPADLPLTVYFPVGVGEMNCEHTLMIVPTHVQMRLLTEAGYTPSTELPTGSSTGALT